MIMINWFCGMVAEITISRLHCVKSVRIWSYSSPYSIQMREIRTRITSNRDTFYAVLLVSNLMKKMELLEITLISFFAF